MAVSAGPGSSSIASRKRPIHGLRASRQARRPQDQRVVRHALCRAEFRVSRCRSAPPRKASCRRSADAKDLRSRFYAVHDQYYGFHSEHDPVEIINVRLTASAALTKLLQPEAGQRDLLAAQIDRTPTGLVRWRSRDEDADLQSRGAATAPIDHRARRSSNNSNSTTVLYPGDRLRVDEVGNLLVKIRHESAKTIDPITTEIIANGLRSIADETFIALMKSAYSTNIKERRDHSTAICDRHGRLIAQAEASLPIHIASMTGLMQHLLAAFCRRHRGRRHLRRPTILT